MGSVPSEPGTGRCRASEPASASTSTIGRKRPSSIASPVAVSHHGVFTVMPPNAEPLLLAELVKAYRTSERPCGPVLSAVLLLPVANAAALNTGPHALSEVLYAFTSAANNNGSAFGGITVNTPWWDTALGLAMLLGLFLPILLVLALAGSLARQKAAPESEGTLPTHQPLFVGMVVGVTVVLVALTFLPALALGPIAEGLS